MSGLAPRPLGLLQEQTWLTPLVRHVLTGVSAEMRVCLGTRNGPPAPAWSSPWFERWRAEQIAGQADETGVLAATAALTALQAGDADVVITGQQPGFLGGPLYTLLKVATCIAVAEARSRAGRPTVPLFWSGDDDDDLNEALAVRVWDPSRGVFLKPEVPHGVDGTMVGALAARVFGPAERAWLATVDSTAAATLVSLWDDALAGGWTWGALHAEALRTVFPDRGLLIVSGNDSDLMASARPLWEQVFGLGPDLADLVRDAGADLESRGYHAQIGVSSLARPVLIAQGSRRRRLASLAEAECRPEGSLRPGVLLRSPCQDWLFRPAAVIVGPGERAYLEQLRPLYERLDLTRAPLLPRAHAVLGARPETEASTADDLEERVDAVVAAAAADLASALTDLGSDDAAARARRAAGRWRSTVARVLSEATREGRRSRSEDVVRDDWRSPRGERQERILPGLWAVALFEDLPTRLSALADDHVRRCTNGDPCVYELPVADEALEDLR